jgi:nucleotide-binding universal stress UspA family protein
VYAKILIPIEVSDDDSVIIEHIRPLARQFGSKIVLFHVATGWNARFYRHEADSEEMRSDAAYLEKLAAKLRRDKIEVETVLGTGDPVTEIVTLARRIKCDLIAMTTHGHRFISDVLYGSTAEPVRHRVDIPVLLLRAPRKRRLGLSRK